MYLQLSGCPSDALVSVGSHSHRWCIIPEQHSPLYYLAGPYIIKLFLYNIPLHDGGKVLSTQYNNYDVWYAAHTSSPLQP